MGAQRSCSKEFVNQSFSNTETDTTWVVLAVVPYSLEQLSKPVGTCDQNKKLLLTWDSLPRGCRWRQLWTHLGRIQLNSWNIAFAVGKVNPANIITMRYRVKGGVLDIKMLGVVLRWVERRSRDNLYLISMLSAVLLWAWQLYPKTNKRLQYITTSSQHVQLGKLRKIKASHHYSWLLLNW